MVEQLTRENHVKIYLVLCLSLLLNIFLLCQHFLLPPSRLDSTGSELSWTQDAAEEAETVAAISCSGHGHVYVDGVLDNGWPTCECHTCYTGADCSVLLSNCSADVNGLVIGRLYNISILDFTFMIVSFIILFPVFLSLFFNNWNIVNNANN